MKLRERTDRIVIHCSYTPPSMDIGAEEIRRWHRQKGWLDIGYHFVIRRDGTVEKGREMGVVGAHAEGWNERSVGICLVGGMAPSKEAGKVSEIPEDNFTNVQFESLETLVTVVHEAYPTAQIIGHYQVEPAKACPCFNASAWAKDNGYPTIEAPPPNLSHR